MALWRLCNSLRCWFKTSIVHPLDAAPDRHTVTFADLPPEMIHYIRSFLPAPSAAALALCNRKISSVLGTQYWKALGSWREGGGRKPAEILCMARAMVEEPLENARSDFLTLLERDLPDYIFCRRCALLHLPIFELDSQDDCNRFCAVADICSLTLIGLPPQIRFSLLQWTMKRHRMGFNCCKELNYFFFEERSYQRHSGRRDCGRYYIKEARIRNRKVLVRAQDWFLLPASHIGPLSDLAIIGICSHLWHREEGGLLTLMIDCKLSHWRSKSPCSACDGLRQCHYCYTEFQLDVKDFGKRGVALVITTWLDLGECRTPLDPKWGLRICHRPCLVSTGSEQDVVVFEPGNIQESFGDGRAFLFDSILTPKREKALLRTGIV